MDISKAKTAEKSEGPSDFSKESKVGVQGKPITVQELGNMYAEWRMANELSPGTEKWMQNQTILLIPAPKRKFNWKACWILLVTMAIGGIIAFGIFYYVDNYTSFKITSGRKGIGKFLPKYEVTTKKIDFGPEFNEQMRLIESHSKQIEEISRAREESIRMAEEAQRAVEQYRAMRPMIDPVSEYEKHQKARQEEHENLKAQVREFLSHLQTKGRVKM